MTIDHKCRNCGLKTEVEITFGADGNNYRYPEARTNDAINPTECEHCGTEFKREDVMTQAGEEADNPEEGE